MPGDLLGQRGSWWVRGSKAQLCGVGEFRHQTEADETQVVTLFARMIGPLRVPL